MLKIYIFKIFTNKENKYATWKTVIGMVQSFLPMLLVHHSFLNDVTLFSSK